MRHRREETKGWVTSVAVHGLLLLFLWMVKVSDISLIPDFVEVSWSSVGTPPTSMTLGNVAPLEASSIANSYSSTKVRLPERLNLEPPHEILRVSDAKKLELAEVPKLERKVVDARGVVDKGSGISLGEIEKVEAPVFAGRSRDIKPPFGAAVGGESDRSVGFEVAWAAGGKRGLLSGKLPEYPEGVNLEAQIKILAVVFPDGSVKSVQPSQKANTKLEEAALKEVRFWKFEPLPKTSPQIDQSCTITFNFLLR